MKFDLIDETNLKFHVVVLGPDGSSYEGGEWHYEFELVDDYPFHAPCKQNTLKAFTKLYHPTVTNLEEGIPHFLSCSSCSDDGWCPGMTIATRFGELRRRMMAPDLDHLDCCSEIVKQSIQVSKQEFEEKAREWTQKYAVPKYDELFDLKDE